MKKTQIIISLFSLAFFIVVFAGLSACKGQEKSSDQEKGQAEDIDVVLNFNWFHYHEAGGNDTLSFKHKPFDFPPSRGRIGFMMMENNKLEFWAIGPTDIPEKLQGSWSLTDGVLDFSVKGSDMVQGFEQSYQIIKAEKDLFILFRK
jgi:hypothetical protein